MPTADTDCWLEQQSLHGEASPTSNNGPDEIAGASSADRVEAAASWCACTVTVGAADAKSAPCPACDWPACVTAATELSRQNATHAACTAGTPASANTAARLVSRCFQEITSRVYRTVARIPCRRQSAVRLSRKALPMTETELNVIAALARIGLSSRPNIG